MALADHFSEKFILYFAALMLQLINSSDQISVLVAAADYLILYYNINNQLIE